MLPYQKISPVLYDLIFFVSRKINFFQKNKKNI